MKKEYIYGLGVVAFIFYLLWKEEKDKNKKRAASQSVQPQSTLYWGFPLGYGGGGDVNQNVNVYQSQGTTAPTTQTVAASTPIQMASAPMGRGKGR